MIADIFIPLITVGLAEFGDKTQLLILFLSSKTKKHFQLLLGVMLAFLIVDGIAVLLGSWVINIISIGFLKILSGIVFIIFGLSILRSNKERNEDKLYFKNSFLSGFVLIFITEWGDKTQIASGLFAMRYNGLMVLIGSMMALSMLSIMAIYLGKSVLGKIEKRTMTKISGIFFILIGISLFLF